MITHSIYLFSNNLQLIVNKMVEAHGKVQVSVPVIALVGIFDRQNEPIVLQNYLARYHRFETS